MPVCTAKWKFWWENFRGATKKKPRLPNTCYAIFDRSSLFREQRRHECELYFGIHDSFQFEPSLRQCSEVVVRPRSYLPVSLVVWLSRLYWQLQCWKLVRALIANHRAVVVPTPRAGNTCIVPPFKVDFDLHLRSIGHVPITKKFTENIFADSHKAAKFVKIFSLGKIPLYGISRKEDLYFPLYGRVVKSQTRRLLESHRESGLEGKLSRLEASTIAICRKGTDRELRH